ncbi:MAG: SEC-C metal-binding domain-containing protein [Thermoanaerobaculia bacterium]
MNHSKPPLLADLSRLERDAVSEFPRWPARPAALVAPPCGTFSDAFNRRGSGRRSASHASIAHVRSLPAHNGHWRTSCARRTRISAFEVSSKRRKGYPSETRVKRGIRIVHDDKELLEKLGRNDPCPCGSGRRFQEVLYALGTLRRLPARPLLSAEMQGAGPWVRRRHGRLDRTVGCAACCASRHGQRGG